MHGFQLGTLTQTHYQKTILTMEKNAVGQNVFLEKLK